MNTAVIMLALSVGIPAALEGVLGGRVFGIPAARDTYDDVLPDGAIARLGSARWRLTGTAGVLLFGRDNRSCYTFGNSSNNFEYPSGKAGTVPALPGSESSDTAQFSPDGRYIYCSRRQGLFRFDRFRNTSELLFPSSRFNFAYGQTVLAYAIAEDGRTALVAARSVNPRNPYAIYRIRLGRPCEIKLIAREIYSTADFLEIALSADGRYMAIVEGEAGRGSKARLHVRYRDFDSGQTTVHSLETKTWPIAVRFAPASGGLIIRTLDELLRLDNPLTAADGRGRIRVRKAVPPGGADTTPSGILAVAGDRLLYSDNAGQLVLADCATLKTTWTRSAGSRYNVVRCAAFTADRRAVGFTDSAVNCYGTTVRFLDAATGRETTLPGHRYEASKVAFHPNRPLLATASLGNEVRLWAWETRGGAIAFRPAGAALLEPFTEPPMLRVEDVQFVDGGKRLLVPGGFGHQFECELAKGFQFRNEQRFGSECGMPLRYSEDGRRCVSWDNQTSAFFLGKNLEFGRQNKKLDLVPGRVSFNHQAFSGDGQLAAFALLPGGVAYVDTTWGERVAADRVPGMRFAGRRRFLTAAEPVPTDNFSTYWLIDLRTGRNWCAPVVGWTAHAFSADGRYAAIADPDTNTRVQLIELAGGRVVRTFSTNGNSEGTYLTSLDFAPDGKLLASALSNGTILIWDCDPNRPRMRVYGPRDLSEMAESLSGTNPKRAVAAIGYAVANPTEAMAYFRANYRPALRPDRGDAEKLLRRLSDARYAVRLAAARDLAGIEPFLPGWLDEVKGRKLDAETAAAVRQLAKIPLLPRSAPDELFQVRMVECLERIGSPEAKGYLKELAGRGDWAALMAAIALERLGE